MTDRWMTIMVGTVPRLTFFLIATMGFGCASPNPWSAWRHAVERAVVNAHGDPSALRHFPGGSRTDNLRPSPIIVSALGNVGGRRDVHGMLVDVIEHESKVYLVFLVGVVRREVTLGGAVGPAPRIEDIRLATTTLHRRDFDWSMGPRDPVAIERYVAPRSAPPGAPVTVDPRHVFPHSSDDLRIRSEGDWITVEEANSQASWTMRLPDSPLLHLTGR